MKDYGTEYLENDTFLEKHGGRIGAALCAISTCAIMSMMILAFFMSLPGCIDELAGHSANIVAMSRGEK